MVRELYDALLAVGCDEAIARRAAMAVKGRTPVKGATDQIAEELAREVRTDRTFRAELRALSRALFGRKGRTR